MDIRHFIFSENRSDRVKRHLLFWLLYYVVSVFLQAASPASSIPSATVYVFATVVPQVLFTYALICFILPKYLLRNRYFISILWVILFLITSAVINYLMLEYARPMLAKTLLPTKYFVPRGTAGGIWSLIASFKGTMVAAGIACSIRLIKHWHLKEKRNLELLKEKTEAQLQLLSAQVHPHFLFNTLNNIYSKAQNESSASAKMIMELSHMIRYVLDEGKLEQVLLENELQMLMDYINLEKMRYDDKLDIHLSLPSNTDDVYITPLLLLPFVENCFQHGTSTMIHNPWINLKIELNDTSLVMKLMNGKKDPDDRDDEHRGTGIENVKKRLELLYKDKYDLQINQDEEVFVVNLILELFKDTSEPADQSNLQPKIEYAI